MAKETTTFNEGVESRMMHDNIKKRNWEQCSRSVVLVFFLIMFQKKCKWSLLRFVVVVFWLPLHQYLHYGRSYVLVSIRLYKGLMLRADDEQKEVWAVKIRACKGIHMHGTLVEPLLILISRANPWVSVRSLNGVSLGWVERE
jgi:hypothetical protein